MQGLSEKEKFESASLFGKLSFSYTLRLFSLAAKKFIALCTFVVILQAYWCPISSLVEAFLYNLKVITAKLDPRDLNFDKR